MAWILLTNDDGIEAESLQTLVTALHERGHGCIVFAPSENNSAVSMKISLGKPLSVTKIEDDRDRMHQFSIGGTPCDCIIAALDGGLQKLVPGIMPKLVVSGVNLGPNLSQDAYHSGTIAAAREAGMYGMPAIASSWSSFDPEGMEIAIEATVQLVEAALAVLPDEPANLNRPHVDVNAPHLTSWQKETNMGWKVEVSLEKVIALRYHRIPSLVVANLPSHPLGTFRLSSISPAANDLLNAAIGSSF